MWMKSSWFQKLGGGSLEHLGVRIWSRLQYPSLQARKDPKVTKLIWQILQVEKRSLMTAFEAYNVYSFAHSQMKRPGDFAEVGVFKGGSAKLICEAKKERTLRLFDTYEGLPPMSDKDQGVHRVNQYSCSLESVQAYLKGYENVHYHKGVFPESAVGAPEAKYCFVNFDVDLYAGTKGCLEYFYPRMVPGGIMLSHDYSLLSGVEKAFTEFFADKPEEVIDLPTTQCMVVKL